MNLSAYGVTSPLPANASNNWKVDWPTLPAYTWAGKAITYDVAESDVGSYTQTSKVWDETTHTWTFANTLEETELYVIKKWSLNGADPTADTDDRITGISFYLYRKAGSVSEIVDSETLTGKSEKFNAETNPSGAHPFTITRQKVSGSNTYEWKTHIERLVRKCGTVDYTYWIQEVNVPGYATTPQITLTDEKGAVVNSGTPAPAGSTIVITNSKFTVSLPATGGVGTGVIYGAGAALLLLAVLGLILLNRKRTDGEGIR